MADTSDHAASSPEELSAQAPPAATAEPAEREVVEALAELRGCSVTSIYEAMSNGGGDCRIDSLEGVTVVSMLEHKLGRQPGPDDLQSHQVSSIKSVHSLVTRLR